MTTDQDLGLKLAMERILWAAGYYTRSNVKLAAATRTPTRARGRASADLTDTDVLGIRFLEDLEERKVAVDCKTGLGVSPISRTFWLKGVMQHLAADRGYVVLARAIPDYQRAAAANLGISILTEGDLPVLGARFPVLPAELRIGHPESHRYLEGNITQLPAPFHPLLEFRDTAFWYYGYARAVSQAIGRTARAREAFDFNQKFHKALLLDVIGLFSIALLGLAFEVSRLAGPDLLENLRSLFFGGPEGIARREQILRTIEGLIAHISQQGRLELGEVGQFQLDPPYLTGLAEVLTRLIARPLEAAEVPRYLKLHLMHNVLYSETDLATLLGPAYSTIAHKLSGDVVIAFLRASGFDVAVARQLGVME